MSDKGNHGSGSGTEIVYRIEARSSFIQPEEVNGIILDNRWRIVTFDKSPIGVKNRVFSGEAKRHGFLSYGAALALAHWFLSDADHSSVEVRLVKIKLSYSYETEEEGVSESISHTLGKMNTAVFTSRGDEAS